MRRLPVYLLIDTSGSMRGEPIESVNVGIQTMIASLRQDPYALESVYLSIITFDKKIEEVVPLTELLHVQIPTITTPESGPTFLGKALNTLHDKVKTEVQLTTKEKKGDWMPLLFVMTDGKPSDLQDFREAVIKIKTLDFGIIVGCAAGTKAKESYLNEFCTNVVTLETTDVNSFQAFFKWVSESVSIGNKSIGAIDDISLPPPPDEINLVL